MLCATVRLPARSGGLASVQPEEEAVGVIKAEGTRAEEIRSALARLVAERSFSKVIFREAISPSNNPMEDDYVVTYEGVFLPADLEHAYLKIFVTEIGEVGIGFETRERLSQRLGIRLRTRKKAFAAGRELASISADELINFVTVVAQGDVTLHAHVGVMGLGRVNAIVKPDVAKAISGRYVRHWDWLTISARELPDSPQTRVVRFEPW